MLQTQSSSRVSSFCKRDSMDQSEYPYFQTLTRFMKTQFEKKMTQYIFLSVSVFSLLLSRSSWLWCLHCSISRLPLQLFTHTIDKKCMFIVCNGLVAFLLKFSVMVGSSSRSGRGDEDACHSVPRNETMQETGFRIQENVEVEDKHVTHVHEEQEAGRMVLQDEEVMGEEEGEEKTMTLAGEQKELKEATSFAQEEDEKEEERYEEEDEELVEVEEEEEEEEEDEELNKKFDDFIRRMKEELRIEAQQQLVMV